MYLQYCYNFDIEVFGKNKWYIVINGFSDQSYG